MRWTAIVSGVLGFLLFIAVPFLPVNQTQSQVSWPQNDSLGSIIAPLISVAPESLQAEIPLAATEHLREGQSLVLGTVPADSEEATNRGLFVNYAPDSGLTVSSLDEVVAQFSPSQLEQQPDDAALRLDVTAEGLEATVGEGSGKLEASSEDDLRPQVTGIYTELADTAAARAALPDLKIDVEVNSRFTSSPTVLKLAAMWLGLALLVVALFTLWRIDRLDGRRYGFMPATWKQIRPLDGVVAAVLGFWYVFGANTSDDGFIFTMARVSEHSGYMANYYRWYGVPEAPFGSPYYDILAFLAQISTSSLVMRLPSLVAALIIWFILSREILPRFGSVVNERRVSHWTAAFMFLAFWLPYNNGTRPEPMVALGVMFTWASFERAIEQRRLLPAAVGTIAATLTLGVGPTGLFAVGVFLVCLPQLFSIMGERARAVGWVAPVAGFLASGTAILTLVFADQTLATVLESTSVRSAVGPALEWYNEYVRYSTLFGESVDGSLTRRFAMFTMLFCLALIVYAFIKDRRVVGAEPGPTTRLLLIYGLSVFFLMFTPTKWTHHFGIYAGVAGVIAALGAVVLSQIAMRSTRARTFALAAVTFLLAISLAGWNAWWYVSSFGVPWWDRTIQLKGVQATTVVLAIGMVIVAVGIVQSIRRETRRARFASEDEFRAAESQRVTRLTGVMSAPIAIACMGVVAVSVLSFAKAYADQLPAYSVGKGNVAALAGNKCAMANEALIETNTNDSFLKPVTGTLGESLDDPDGRGFDPNNIPDSIEGEELESGAATAGANRTQGGAGIESDASRTAAGDAKNGSAVGAGNAASAGTDASDKPDGAESDTAGGARETVGINGSTKVLPFNLDYNRVPVTGSWSEAQAGTATMRTQWYELPEGARDNDKTPLLVVSAAGSIYHHDVNGIEQDGQELVLEYGRENGGKVEKLGEAELSDVGATPKWRNLRLPLESLPADADVVRLVATDESLDEDEWLAFTPPRVPELETINDRFGLETPGLLDWSVALQFPCQRTFDHFAGITEIPEYRILPDAAAQGALTDFQSFSGGGAMATADAVNYSYEIPSYLNHDWARDWGAIEKYELRTNSEGTAPAEAEVDHEVITRSGWWKNSDMKIREQD